VTFVLVVFHFDFQTNSYLPFSAIVLQNLFSKFCILVETSFFQKLTIFNSPTNLAEEEDSATK